VLTSRSNSNIAERGTGGVLIPLIRAAATIGFAIAPFEIIASEDAGLIAKVVDSIERPDGAPVAAPACRVRHVVDLRPLDDRHLYGAPGKVSGVRDRAVWSGDRPFLPPCT